MCHYTLQDTLALREKLKNINQLQQDIDAQKPLQSALWPTIQEKLRIDWTYDSNAIEGSTLTRGETWFFLREGLTVEGKPFKDFLDARNHAEAIDYLYQVIQDKRPITPGLIKELNALLLLGVTDTEAINAMGERIKKPATPGQYKSLPNHVLQADGTIHYYTEPLQVADEIEELCQWIQAHLNSQHPLITGAIAHYNLVRIHPFDDGNGRGARILMNLILIKKGYPPAIIRQEERRQYLATLNQADNGDNGPFLIFVANALLKTQQVIFDDMGPGNK
ncbi:MAG TPA: cell filamentation protein Fic [Gammaproteobacteria bacterium]|nr:cell filamentation protein Fic [Gammaproteobacteria bacterium]